MPNIQTNHIVFVSTNIFRIDKFIIYIVFFTMSFVSILPTQISLGELLFWLYIFISFKIYFIVQDACDIRKHFIFYFILFVYLFLQLINQIEYSIKDFLNPIYFMVFLYFVYIFVYKSRNYYYIIIKSFLYSIYIHFIISVLQLLFPNIFYFGLDASQLSPLGNFYRVTGLFTNPNDLMLYLSPMIPFTYLFRFHITRYVLLTTLLLTFSKVAMVVVSITILYDILKSKIRTKFILFIIFFLLSSFFYEYIDNAIMTITHAIEYRFTNANSLGDRLNAFYKVIQSIDDWLLFGAGPMGDLKFSEVRIHNLFLSLIVQYGIIALIVGLAIFLYIWLHYIYDYRFEKKYYIVSLMIWIAGEFVNTFTYIKALYILPIICYIVIVNNKRVK